MSTCLFIFRRDLRLDDNTGLIQALKDHDYVIPLFIFTPAQISTTNTLRSSNCIQFMIESLEDLDSQIKKVNPKCGLWVEYGEEIKIINNVYNIHKFNSLYVNEDYTPYSIARDNKIEKWCKNKKVNFDSFTDILLVDDNIDNIFANNGNIYYVYNLFYKKAKSFGVRNPSNNVRKNYLPKKDKFKDITIKKLSDDFIKKGYYDYNENLAIIGGSTEGKKILLAVKNKKFSNYNKIKDMLDTTTTRLSAHNKFGTISIRREYETFGADKSGEMRRKLYWRDFYYYLSIHDKDYYKYNHLTKDTKNYNLWDNTKNLKF